MSAKRTRTRRPAAPKAAAQATTAAEPTAVEQVPTEEDIAVAAAVDGGNPEGPEGPPDDQPEAPAVEQVDEKPVKPRQARKDPRLCVLRECDRAAIALGLCGAHYASRRGDHA